MHTHLQFVLIPQASILQETFPQPTSPRYGSIGTAVLALFLLSVLACKFLLT
jgi:hypothetical protein